MKKIILKDIISILPDTTFVGNEEDFISYPTNLERDNINPHALMWANAKGRGEIKFIKAGTIICTELPSEDVSKNCNYIFTSSPRQAFAMILRAFFVDSAEPFLSELASIDKSVELGTNCTISHFCVIHENVTLGKNVFIGNNSVVHSNTVIGNNVTIGSNCTIGGVGFGYEKDDDGSYVLLPHIGNVVIRDNVEIGSNTTIDRAVMGSTILNENVKVDNLVHIAHGVAIGKNSLIIANAMIAGSSIIGENVWVAPSSSIINKVTIGDNAVIGLGAVVVKNVSEMDVVVGNPAKSIRR